MGLLQLSSQGLADLFETSLRIARGDEEGEAWNASANSGAGGRVGKLLFNAVRKEAMRWPDGAALLRQVQLRQDREQQVLEQAHDLPPISERHCEFFFWGESAQRAPNRQARADNAEPLVAAT